MNRKKRREAGAIAIEAILSLSIFIMAILAIMMGAMLVRAQSAMQYALDQTAKEVSGYFYLLDKIGVASMISGEETDTATAGLAKLNGSIEDIINFSGSVKDEAQELSATAENAISGNLTDEDIARIQGLGDDYTALQGELNNIRDDLRALRNGDKKLMFKSILQVFSRTLINKSFSYLVTPLVCEALVPKYLTSGDLDAFYRESGIHDIRFEGSEILADGRSINLVCTYKVDASRLTLGFYRKDLQFVQVASTAAWVRPNSSGSLVSLEKICANYDAEYAAAHSISVEEEPATTAASEASTDTTDSSTDTDTSDSTTGTDTSDESESSTTATTLSPEEQIFQQWAEMYGLAPSQVDNIRHAYETFDDDLISAIGSCSNQMAAVFFVATYEDKGAKLLVAAGEDGMQVFNQLDGASRPVLIANTVTADDAYVRALIAWIKSERITHNLTQTQIDTFAAQYRNGGGANPEAEVPERTTPTTETTTKPSKPSSNSEKYQLKGTKEQRIQAGKNPDNLRNLVVTWAADYREYEKTFTKKERTNFNTATIVFDESTGKVYYGRNNGVNLEHSDKNTTIYGDEKNPGLLPEKGYESFPVGNCAEVDAINNALNDGAKLENLHMYTIFGTAGGVAAGQDHGHGVEGDKCAKCACKNCTATFKGKIKTNYAGWTSDEEMREVIPDWPY